MIGLLRKIGHLNIVLVWMLLFQLAICPANTLGSERAGITVEQAVQIVRDNFTIPEEYTRLSTSYNDYNNLATYSLNWDADEPMGNFHAEVDANNGDILGISQWKERDRPYFKLPLLSSEDALKIANDLITKLVSKHQSEIQLIKDNQQVFISENSQPFTYNYRWIRLVNGIPFPENGVSVSVSGEDGQIINYNYNWTEGLAFPAASNLVSAEQARQVFEETPMLELQYFLPPMTQTKEPQRVLLVYQLTNKYYGGAIDALTGKPLTIDKQAVAGLKPANEIGSTSAAIATTSVSTINMASSVAPLTALAADQDSPENSQQISENKAIEIVKKLVKIPKDFVLRNSSLNPDWHNPNEQVWELHWSSDSSNAREHGYLSALVNARTGDLMSFNISDVSNLNDKAKPINRREAQKIADDFLKRAQPEGFELVKAETQDPYLVGLPANIQMFNYVRYVDGIPVSRNGMFIVVDTLAKQVISYELQWTYQDFPTAASDLLSLKQITEVFLKLRPLALRYSLIFQPNGQPEARLVYQARSGYNVYDPAILDAKTGVLMDRYGNPPSQWSRANTFKDVQGHYAEKEIGIMGLMGAFGEYGENFRPDEKISTGSLLRAMLTAEGNHRDQVLSDEDVLKIAHERGWLDDSLKPESELSREDLAKIMIRLINMEPSAKVKGIYAVPFTDAKGIQPDSLGYMALAWGLGILKADENTLRPNQAATRAEAAYALVHAYSVEQPANITR